MVKRIVFAWMLLCLAIPALAQNKTELSKKAAKIKSGTSREAVIELLGPATWAVLPGDDGPGSIRDLEGVELQLQWHNGPTCFPATLIFDADMKVVGIDAGATCFDEPLDPSWLPGSEYSCEKDDRSEFCNP
jgi:hypothetical protein